MRVIVTEYQPAWVEQFEEEAQALKQILMEILWKKVYLT